MPGILLHGASLLYKLRKSTESNASSGNVKGTPRRNQLGNSKDNKVHVKRKGD
jgi:hypothetical protein